MAPARPSDVGELGVVAELGGAQGEARVGRRRGHVWLVWGERGLEGVGVGGVARLVVGEDGRRGEDPVMRVRVVVVVVVRADAQGHLVDYCAPLRVGEPIAVLQEGRAPGGQDGRVGVGVVGGGGSGGEGPTGPRV